MNLPKAQLLGQDGNVFNLIGICNKAMKRFGRDNPDYDAKEQIDLMFKEVQEGDYDNALRVMMKYCEVS